MFQPDKSDFILAVIKVVEEPEARNNCTLMKNRKVKMIIKTKMGRSILFYLCGISSARSS